jgi:hypothetical protein
MDAKLSPNGVSAEEYGYVEATVVALSDFPLTPTALMRRFENESLTAAIMTNGPVTEVRLKLHADNTDDSGYRWSSGKSPLKLLSGTLCDVLIVTSRQRPISLITPWLGERHKIL